MDDLVVVKPNPGLTSHHEMQVLSSNKQNYEMLVAPVGMMSIRVSNNFPILLELLTFRKLQRQFFDENVSRMVIKLWQMYSSSQSQQNTEKGMSVEQFSI